MRERTKHLDERTKNLGEKKHNKHLGRKTTETSG